MRNVHRFMPRLILFALSSALLFSSEARAAALYYLYDSAGNKIATIDPATVQTTIGTSKIADGAVTNDKLAAPVLVGAAKVNADGSIAFQSGGVGVTRTSAGRYTVTFNTGNWPAQPNKVFLSATVISDRSGGGTWAPTIYANILNWDLKQVSVVTRFLWANYYNGSGANASFTDQDQDFWIVAYRIP